MAESTEYKDWGEHFREIKFLELAGSCISF